MTTPAPNTPIRAGWDVKPDDQIVAFIHGLGGPVEITAFDADGDRVGYLVANPISDVETEVIVIPGTATRLVAELTPPED